MAVLTTSPLVHYMGLPSCYIDFALYFHTCTLVFIILDNHFTFTSSFVRMLYLIKLFLLTLYLSVGADDPFGSLTPPLNG